MSVINKRDLKTGRILPSDKEIHDSSGYVYVCISTIEDSTLREMCKQTILNRAYGKRRSGRTYKHHLEMIKKIGRPLEKGEIVHHIDGDRKNNDISNLIIISQKDHIRDYRRLLFENRILKDLLEKNNISYSIPIASS